MYDDNDDKNKCTIIMIDEVVTFEHSARDPSFACKLNFKFDTKNLMSLIEISFKYQRIGHFDF